LRRKFLPMIWTVDPGTVSFWLSPGSNRVGWLHSTRGALAILGPPPTLMAKTPSSSVAGITNLRDPSEGCRTRTATPLATGALGGGIPRSEERRVGTAGPPRALPQTA